MHDVHAYRGIVLSKRPVREADVLVSILTEHGLLRAMARSARAEKSKLRYGLEPLTFARFSVVLGKREWKLVGVEEVSRAFIQTTLPERQALFRISTLLVRLMPGQEPGPELYTTVAEGFALLASQPHDRAASLEAVLVLRILSHLGYLPHTPALAPFVEGEFSIELSAQALKARALLVRTINESLKATGL